MKQKKLIIKFLKLNYTLVDLIPTPNEIDTTKLKKKYAEILLFLKKSTKFGGKRPSIQTVKPTYQ